MLMLCAQGTLLGATILNFFPTLPQTLTVAVFFFLILICIAFVIWLTNKNWVRQIGILLLAMSIGWMGAFWAAKQRLAWQLMPEWDQQEVELTGMVTGITHFTPQLLRLDVNVEKINKQIISHPEHAKVRLYWKKPTQVLYDGDRLTAVVSLVPLTHLANPGTFDQEKQFFIEGIRATGKIIKILFINSNDRWSLNKTRQKLNDKLAALLPNHPFMGVLQAMTLGINQGISAHQWQVFQVTGITHIISISGSHIGLVAILCFKMMSFIMRRWVRFTLIAPAKCFGALLAMVSGIIYSALAGFSIPTQRACIMLIAAMIAVLKRQPVLSWDTLAFAWLVIFLIDPLAPLQMGFWLSFGCVAALILGQSACQNASKWQRWWWPQWVVFVGLLPLSVVFFQQVPLLSPIANFIALPVIGFLVVPFSLCALMLVNCWPWFATFCLSLAHEGMALLWYVLAWLAKLPFSVWYQASPPLGYWMIAVVGAVVLLLPKSFPARHLGWIILLPLICYRAPLLKVGDYRFTLLDVGQGLAAVIQTRHHTLLFDAGPRYGESRDAGSMVIRPFLLNQGIDTLDKIIISHGDLDHRAGLSSLAPIKIGEIFTSEPHKITQPSQLCRAGEKWQWDGVEFTILNPSNYQLSKRNDLSCVLSVSSGEHRILLTGDIERQAELNLLTAYKKKDLKAEILVVPHHGSLTSSSMEFIQAVSPDYALYPVGERNRYGFPKAAIWQRYAANGSTNLSVAQKGALIFHLQRGQRLTPPTCWRETSKHYWHNATLTEE